MWSLLFSQEKMYLTMPLSGQVQGGAAGGLSQEQTSLLPSESWIRQKADCSVVIRGSWCNSGWREPWAGLALSSDPVCSGPCPGGFWNLPGTEGGWAAALDKLCRCLHVRRFLLVQGWNVSSHNLWPLLLPCTTAEPHGSFWWPLMVLSGSCWVPSKVASPEAEPALLPLPLLSP